MFSLLRGGSAASDLRVQRQSRNSPSSHSVYRLTGGIDIESMFETQNVNGEADAGNDNTINDREFCPAAGWSRLATVRER